MLVLACVKPLPRRITPKDIKRAVQQANNVCYESHETPACRIMWDRVGDLTHAYARQVEREEEQKRENALKFWIEKEEELETREYDV